MKEITSCLAPTFPKVQLGASTPVDPGKQQGRILRRLLRDLAILATADSDKPRRPRQIRQRRILYRRGELSDADLLRLVEEVGIERIWHALEKMTQPQLPLQAAE
jgi:hypothetical protein